MHTDTHRHTHTPRRCSTVVSTRAALRPKRLKESETGSFSVRGTTPPISPRTTRTLFNRRPRHPSSPRAGQVSLPPAASPLTSQHDDDPGQWYWFCATASTGMCGVAWKFVAPVCGCICGTSNRPLAGCILLYTVRDPDTNRAWHNGARV